MVRPRSAAIEIAARSRSVAQSPGRNLSVSSACLLWLRHVLDAEAETRAMRRAVLDWSRFLDDRRGALTRIAEQLELTWPNGGESAFADIDELVSPDLRHHKASEADLVAHPAISELIRETYSAMLELGDEPGNNFILRRLDDLRARFELAAAIFGEAAHALEEDLRDTRSRAAERDASAARLAAERDALAAQLAGERDTVAQLSARRDALALQLSAALSERDIVSERLLGANEQIDHAEAAIAHIGRRYAEKYGAPKSLFRQSLSGRSSRLASSGASRKDLEAIRNSLFFDERFYLETNPDVRETGTDAALHYLLHGGVEGRDPGPFFSTEAYLARYPDIAAASLNPLLHYEAHGRRENRRLLPYSVKNKHFRRTAED